MRRMDTEMVLEVPDTPERLSFTRSAGESSSRARGIEDKPSSSNQYLEPIARNYSQQMKNSGFYDFSGNNAAHMDSDLLFSHSRRNQLMSGTRDIRTTHSSDCSFDAVRSGFMHDSGIGPKMIDLSQDSPSPLSRPTTHRGARHKEEKHLSRHNERIEIIGHGKLGVQDFNGDQAAPINDDFLFSQAKLARFISDTHHTETMDSYNSVPELGQRSMLNTSTGPEMIDLSQESPPALPYPTRHRGGPRFKEDKYLSRQSKRNEISGCGTLGKRDLNPIGDFGKEKNNAINCSKSFGSSNNITEPVSRRCHVSMVPSDKEVVVVQPLNSQTTNERLQTGHPDLRISQSIIQQNKLPIGCISPCDLISNNNCQAKGDCKEQTNPGDKRALSSSLTRNQGTEIRNRSHKVSQSTTRQTNYNHLDIVLHPKKNGRRMLVHNGCISPSNMARKNNEATTKGTEEGGVLASKMPKTNSSHPTHLDVVVHPKSSGANNECNSHSNIARNDNYAQARGFGGRATKIPNGNPSKFIHDSSVEGRTIDIGKGKEIMNEVLLANSHHTGTVPSSRRSCLIPGKELKVISEMEYDTERTNGHGVPHKHVESSALPFSFTTAKCMSENIPSHLSSSSVEMSKGVTGYAHSVNDKPEGAILQSGENITQNQGCFGLASEAPHHKGKRKNSFAHSNAGECSSSTVSSRISYDRRLAKPSDSRSIRSRKSERVDTALEPIVESNELNSSTKDENHELSDESIARSIQFESDEELARRLQEQFYLESPPVGATEVESTREWSLLQEDEDLYASFRRPNQFLQREALPPYLLGQPRFHPSTRMTARVRTQAENEIGRLRRHISRPNLSLEERLGLLEALEAAFENANDMDTPGRFIDGQREFDESDYEMLLALDDNNHHVGASERQINNLPQSLNQNTDSQEACAVCLETPAVGDTIRHLPCLHKFHKDCIDTWLRRKRSCPICKCSIT